MDFDDANIRYTIYQHRYQRRRRATRGAQMRPRDNGQRPTLQIAHPKQKDELG